MVVIPCILLHNSKCRPNNDVLIHFGRFGCFTLMLTATLCQHRSNRIQVTVEEEQGAQASGKFPPINLCRENYCQVEQKTESNCMAVIFENSHVILSWYVRYLNTNNFHGSSCTPAILLRVQRSTLQKGKHSCSCDCTHQGAPSLHSEMTDWQWGRWVWISCFMDTPHKTQQCALRSRAARAQRRWIQWWINVKLSLNRYIFTISFTYDFKYCFFHEKWPKSQIFDMNDELHWIHEKPWIQECQEKPHKPFQNEFI